MRPYCGISCYRNNYIYIPQQWGWNQLDCSTNHLIAEECNFYRKEAMIIASFSFSPSSIGDASLISAMSLPFELIVFVATSVGGLAHSALLNLKN